jgi:pimeloyl-ACP methyl ester carboxylesterase
VVPQPTAAAISATPLHYAEVNGVTLGYREFGSGEPVLLIEGFGATMDTWNATFIGILASKYHVYTYDHRGMGHSTNNNATPTISQYADDAAGLIQALGYDSMNVYGVSMGSSTSQQLAIDHPQRVRKLVLSSSTYSVRIPECVNLLNVLESVAVDPNQTDGVRREAQANLAWNGSYDGLAGIHKDVMLIVGTNDALTPDPVSVRIAGQIKGSWLVRFAGIPHAGEHYAPVEYGQSVLNFLGMNESPAVNP